MRIVATLRPLRTYLPYDSDDEPRRQRMYRRTRQLGTAQHQLSDPGGGRPASAGHHFGSATTGIRSSRRWFQRRPRFLNPTGTRYTRSCSRCTFPLHGQLGRTHRPPATRPGFREAVVGCKRNSASYPSSKLNILQSVNRLLVFCNIWAECCHLSVTCDTTSLSRENQHSISRNFLKATNWP